MEVSGRNDFVNRLEVNLDEWARHCLDNRKLAGFTVLIGSSTGVDLAKAYGYRDIESVSPMTVDAIFRIASLTKPLTSAVALTLIEKKYILLDDPISVVAPEFETMLVYNPKLGTCDDMLSPITFRHLLNHTAGFSYEYNADPALQSIYKNAELFKPNDTIDENIQKIVTIPLNFQPGAQFRYGVATDVLGYLVEKIMGRPLGEVMDEILFRPLGMDDTSFVVKDDKRCRFCSLYRVTGFDDATLVREQAFYDSPFVVGKRLTHGGGGLASTILDYYKFLRMLLARGNCSDCQLMNVDSINEMTRNQLASGQFPIRYVFGQQYDSKGYGYGFGVRVRVAEMHEGPRLGEYGWCGAFNTYFWVDPVRDLIAIFFTQLSPFSPWQIDWEFRKLVYTAMRDQ